MNEILDDNTRTWDVDRVRANFAEIDAEAILRTPVGMGEDFWAWQPDKRGIFSVRSSYKLLIENQGRIPNTSSSDNGHSMAWNTLWKMEVPPKVRCFWWSVIHNFVPCRAVLRDRHIEKIPFCEDCGVEETTYHSRLSAHGLACFGNK